jgi:two-component system copper resistance phosphate regulon response regulator CusR
MKVLIVEDDLEIATFIREGLDEAGYFTTICRDGERALRLALNRWYSIILLDLMLPSLDGISICMRLRESGVNTPIMILTARDALSDRVNGLEAGADDYLVKPFEFDELLARVRALQRRDHTKKQSLVHVGDLVVDTASRTVTRAGRQISLTAREYALMEALATHSGQILSRQSILEHVWLDEMSSSNTVDVFIKNLRQKVDRDPKNKLIHTVYGMGYVLRATPEAVTP